MSASLDAIRPEIDRRSGGAVALPEPRSPRSESTASGPVPPPARPNALAAALARSLAAVEQRNADLEARVQTAGAELARTLHGLTLGHAVLRHLDLPPEARAIVLQQQRGYDAALATLHALRVAPSVPQDPGARDPHQDAVADERESRLPHGCRVLVIDDDAAVRLATRLLLEMLGLDVRVAAGRDDALASVATEVPDVVVADCHLSPADTGEAVLHALETRCARSLPAVLVSGDLQLPSALDGRVVLQKPFRGEALLAAMRAALGKGLSSVLPALAPVPAPIERAAW